MNRMDLHFMAEERHSLRLQRNLADAFAVLCQHFGSTPKAIAREIAQDPRTARNALEGKAGTPVITGTLQARQKAAGDHYDLWLALGEMIFGESLDEYERRKLETLIESTHNAQSLHAARQARREQLRTCAASPDSGTPDGHRQRRIA